MRAGWTSGRRLTCLTLDQRSVAGSGREGSLDPQRGKWCVYRPETQSGSRCFTVNSDKWLLSWTLVSWSRKGVAYSEWKWVTILKLFITSEYHTWEGRACWRNMELLLLGKKRGRQRKQAPENPLPGPIPDTWLDFEPRSPPCHMTPSHTTHFQTGSSGDLTPPEGAWVPERRQGKLSSELTGWNCQWQGLSCLS